MLERDQHKFHNRPHRQLGARHPTRRSRYKIDRFRTKNGLLFLIPMKSDDDPVQAGMVGPARL